MLSDTHRCFLARGRKEGREAITKRGEAECGVGVVSSEGCQAAAQPRLGMQCVMGV